MRRPARNPNEPLFGTRTWTVSLLQGLGVLALLVALYIQVDKPATSEDRLGLIKLRRGLQLSTPNTCGINS